MAKLDCINFINTCSSEYVEIYVGTGAKKVREYFKSARKDKPSIIFIDELEAIGAQRSSNYSSYTNNIERNSTLNQLLAEMDGVESNEGILIIAATNREDLLDSALIRPGRFDLKIHLDLPTKEERQRLFELYLKKQEIYHSNSEGLLSQDYDFLMALADKSEGLSGAIIEDIINKASALSYSRGESGMDRRSIEAILIKSKNEHLKFRSYEERNSKYQ